MSISLQKGQRIDLTKGHAGLSKLTVGLGWDPVELGGRDIDCDASVIMLENDRLPNNAHLIYFGNLKSKCGSVKHTGDNLTGDGDGDDEQILIDLEKVPSSINKLVFAVNIYDCRGRKQDFGMIKNAFIRVVNQSNNNQLLMFDLTENYSGKTSLIVAEIYRHGSEWKFAAIGNGTTDAALRDLVKLYQ
ncbi:TerD family protein [Bacillus lacus]|uniref:TerD family protein n=1 Tax=Metabacillus lacus TaxID=1983721 RepID=A0A7X2LWA6_9BACI|nr:TerD family protein [Metabacillus lacus]MRX71270.1 TerD family protein [Metabacillus lacus]